MQGQPVAWCVMFLLLHGASLDFIILSNWLQFKCFYLEYMNWCLGKKERNKLASLGYASPKLRNYDLITDLLTGVKCRATSVAKKFQSKTSLWLQWRLETWIMQMTSSVNHSFCSVNSFWPVHFEKRVNWKRYLAAAVKQSIDATVLI